MDSRTEAVDDYENIVGSHTPHQFLRIFTRSFTQVRYIVNRFVGTSHIPVVLIELLLGFYTAHTILISRNISSKRSIIYLERF